MMVLGITSLMFVNVRGYTNGIHVRLSCGGNVRITVFCFHSTKFETADIGFLLSALQSHISLHLIYMKMYLYIFFIDIIV